MAFKECTVSDNDGCPKLQPFSPFLVTYITCSLKFASIFPDPFIHSYPKITSALPIQTNKNLFFTFDTTGPSGSTADDVGPQVP